VTTLVQDVVAFCRLFATYERDTICCGTVTVAQCVVLQTLREGAWDVSSLADATAVTKGAMTRLLDGLEKKQWVRRVRDNTDRRRVAIVLTPAGRKEADRLALLTDQSIQTILKSIPADDRTQVVRSIGLLRRAIESVRGQVTCC
jgi:DNA-binding MarR family transcriptional regulator